MRLSKFRLVPRINGLLVAVGPLLILLSISAAGQELFDKESRSLGSHF
jgi:hypothetical protein